MKNSDLEVIRTAFESYIKGSERFKNNTPLGIMEINGRFNRYMDGDTDTMWIGFALGWRSHEKLIDSPANHPGTLIPYKS